MSSLFYKNMTPSNGLMEQRSGENLDESVSIVRFTLPEDEGNWGIVIAHGNDESPSNGNINLSSPQTGGGLGSVILSVSVVKAFRPASQSDSKLRSEDGEKGQGKDHHAREVVDGNALLKEDRNRREMKSISRDEKGPEKIPAVIPPQPRQESLLYLDKKGELEAAMRLLLTTATQSSVGPSTSMASTSPVPSIPGFAENDQLPEVEIKNGKGVDSTTRNLKKRGRDGNSVKVNPKRKCQSGAKGRGGASSKKHVNSQGKCEVARPHLTPVASMPGLAPNDLKRPEGQTENGVGINTAKLKGRKRNKNENETQSQVRANPGRKCRMGRDGNSAKQLDGQNVDDPMSDLELMPPKAVGMVTRYDTVTNDSLSSTTSGSDGGYDLRQRKAKSGSAPEGKVDPNNQKRGQRHSTPGSGSPHTCTVCSKSFSVRATLKSHLLTHTKEGCVREAFPSQGLEVGTSSRSTP